MRGFRALILVTALAVALGAGTAGAGAGPVTKVKRTSGWIEALAMDGPRAAYDVGARGSGCNGLFVWNVLTGSPALISGKGAGVRELAVAGTRVAWIVNLGGNTESDDYLYTASLLGQRSGCSAPPSAEETSTASCRVAGWGDSLGRRPPRRQQLGDGLEERRVRRLAPGARAIGLTTIAAGQAATRARSADLGRVAVLRPDGTVGLYPASGVLLRAVAPVSAKDFALRKDYLVVLTRARTLEIYNANTDAFIRRWSVPAGASHLDVHSGIAVYSLGRQVHASGSRPGPMWSSRPSGGRSRTSRSRLPAWSTRLTP